MGCAAVLVDLAGCVMRSPGTLDRERRMVEGREFSAGITGGLLFGIAVGFLVGAPIGWLVRWAFP